MDTGCFNCVFADVTVTPDIEEMYCTKHDKVIMDSEGEYYIEDLSEGCSYRLPYPENNKSQQIVRSIQKMLTIFVGIFY